MKYRVFIKDESGTIQGTSYPCESAREAVAVTFREVQAGNSNAEPQQSESGEDGTWRKMTIDREPSVANRLAAKLFGFSLIILAAAILFILVDSGRQEPRTAMTPEEQIAGLVGPTGVTGPDPHRDDPNYAQFRSVGHVFVEKENGFQCRLDVDVYNSPLMAGPGVPSGARKLDFVIRNTDCFPIPGPKGYE